MKKILVTGGLGYIGSHTVVSLVEHGYEVVIIDNLVNSNIDILDRIASILGEKPKFYNIDLSNNLEAITTCIKDLKNISGVIHFAALKSVSESIRDPLQYYKNNLYGLINLLKVMEMHKINNLVFSSSATVYGDPESLPLTELSPTKPALSPYGNTKKIGENIIEDFCKANADFCAVSLRYFNPVGAHESAKIGELPNGVPNNLMPFITQTASGKRDILHVFGKDYNTPDGTCIRDYIHVVDLADAHVKTLDRLIGKKQKKNYEVFNLGTGKGSSVLEVIKSFEKTTNQKLPYKIVGRRAGDVAQIYTATDFANKELKWEANRNLDEMTASSWKWEKTYRS